jgi:alpha-1,4-fucosyltransferase
MKHFPVDSFGRCLNNMDYETAGAAEYRGNPADLSLTRQIMARYKFVISHENALIRDYVSEKVFFALQVGVIPVYRGAPNIDRYVPSHSIVNSAAFGSVADLAVYLHALLRDADAYASYLAWKTRPPEPHMVRLVAISSDTMFERICARSKSRRASVLRETVVASGRAEVPHGEGNGSLWHFEPAARFHVDGAWV